MAKLHTLFSQEARAGNYLNASFYRRIEVNSHLLYWGLILVTENYRETLLYKNSISSSQNEVRITIIILCIKD